MGRRLASLLLLACALVACGAMPTPPVATPVPTAVTTYDRAAGIRQGAATYEALRGYGVRWRGMPIPAAARLDWRSPEDTTAIYVIPWSRQQTLDWLLREWSLQGYGCYNGTATFGGGIEHDQYYLAQKAAGATGADFYLSMSETPNYQTQSYDTAFSLVVADDRIDRQVLFVCR